MKRPNIIFYFSDQQRWDTINKEVTPNLCKLAEEGVLFENNYTCQPVCGPARACLQTGLYATQCGCYINGIPLPNSVTPLAHYFNEAGYDTAYIGKWHLASHRDITARQNFETTAIPKERLGEYKYFRGADVLEFTSHGYDGYIFDEDGNRLDFEGYRADCINDYALEYLENRNKDKPFFMFISQLEPHHQNDRHCFEGYRETVDDFKNYPIPPDLSFLNGDYSVMYPDYISAINRLDYNVARLVEKLKEQGIYDNTVIVYTSDHGCHFKTRNSEYKRSCHDSSIHTPLIIKGDVFNGGKTEKRLTSLIDIPPTLLSIAKIAVPDSYMGVDLTKQLTSDSKRDCVFIQISEASNSRAIRTDRYKYEIRDIFPVGNFRSKSRAYYESYLYDLKNDPIEAVNLVKESSYKQIRKELKRKLLEQMQSAGEKTPLILPAFKAKKK